MGFNRVVDADKDNKGVSGLPDTPNMTAAELQARFDSLAELALTKLNQLMDELENTSAAGNVGVIAPSTVKAGNTLQAVINALASSVNKNTTDSHTHANKEVIDAISAQNTKDWSSIVSLLKEITSIQNVLIDSADGIPTSHAVYEAMYNLSFEDVNEAVKTALAQIESARTEMTTEVNAALEEVRSGADTATSAATSASESAESASASAKSASASEQTVKEAEMNIAASVTVTETNANKTEADKTIVEGYMESALSSEKAAAESADTSNKLVGQFREDWNSQRNSVELTFTTGYKINNTGEIVEAANYEYSNIFMIDSDEFSIKPCAGYNFLLFEYSTSGNWLRKIYDETATEKTIQNVRGKSYRVALHRYSGEALGNSSNATVKKKNIAKLNNTDSFTDIREYGACSGTYLNVSGELVKYDNTLAFQNALASGKPIYIPTGTYYIMQDITLDIPSDSLIYFEIGAKLVFAGYEECPQSTPFVINAENIAIYNADIACIELPSERGLSGANGFVTIRENAKNVRLYGKTRIANAVRSGLMIAKAEDIYIEDILVEYCNADGIYIRGAQNVRIDHAEISHNGDDGVSLHNTFFGDETGTPTTEACRACSDINIGEVYVHDYSPNVSDCKSPAMLFGGAWNVHVDKIVVKNHYAPFRTKVGYDGTNEVNYGYSVYIGDIDVLHGTMPSMELYDVAKLTDKANYAANIEIDSLRLRETANDWSAYWGNGGGGDCKTFGSVKIHSLVTDGAFDTYFKTYNHSCTLMIASMFSVVIDSINALDTTIDFKGQTVIPRIHRLGSCNCKQIIVRANASVKANVFSPTHVYSNALYVFAGAHFYAGKISIDSAGYSNSDAAGDSVIIQGGEIIADEIRIRFPSVSSNYMISRGDNYTSLMANTITLIQQDDDNHILSWGLGDCDSRNISNVRIINESKKKIVSSTLKSLKEQQEEKEWKLKGTFTLDEVSTGLTVDLSDCKELVLLGSITGQVSETLIASGSEWSNFLVIGFVPSGTRYWYCHFKDGSFGVEPAICKSGTSESNISSNATGTFIKGKNISEITKLVLNTSKVTACNIEVYAR